MHPGNGPERSDDSRSEATAGAATSVRAATALATGDAPVAAFAPWWGPVRIGQAETRRWRIGPRSLWVTRKKDEVAVAHCASSDPMDRSLEVGVPADGDAPDEAERLRFAVRSGDRLLELVPALADRPAIVRPDAPLTIPAQEEVTLYVHSPVWLVLRLAAAGEREARVLVELPSWRPSDTWFGPNTLRGELAYALATTARFSLSDGAGHPHRATTAIRVRNRVDAPLQLERVKVPLPHLTLYATPTRLWTTSLTLDHDGDEERTALSLGAGVPSEAGPDALHLAPARDVVGGNLVMRAFARIFRSD